MLTDRYDLPLSTASSAARDAYLEGCEAKLTMHPGAIEGFDRAIAADPGFALAHAARAHVLLERGDAAGARASMAAANSFAAGLSAREAGHIAFFDLLVAGDPEAALAALRAHLDAWPRDALVLATTAFTNGLIGSSGRAGQKPASCWPCSTGSRRAMATIGGSPPITAWRFRRTAIAMPRARRLIDPRPRTRATPGWRMPAPTFATRRATPTRPAPSWRPGFPPIRAAACSTAI